MNGLEITLASGSESRRRLLTNAGVRARLVRPGLDEEAAKAAFRREGRSPQDQAMGLAELKAIKVSSQSDGLVVAGDQMLALGDRVFDKPPDLSMARAHLNALSGETHTLETAIVVAESGTVVWRHLARPTLSMRELSPEFIDWYLEAEGDALLSTVGAYRLEGPGVQLFAAIDGDYFSILGLPLLPLLDYFRLRGALHS